MINVSGKDVQVVKFNGNDVKKIIQDGDYIWAKPMGNLTIVSNNSAVSTPPRALVRTTSYEPTAPASPVTTVYYDDYITVQGGPCTTSGYYVYPATATMNMESSVNVRSTSTSIRADKYYFKPSISYDYEQTSGTDSDGVGHYGTLHYFTVTGFTTFDKVMTTTDRDTRIKCKISSTGYSPSNISLTGTQGWVTTSRTGNTVYNYNDTITYETTSGSMTIYVPVFNECRSSSCSMTVTIEIYPAWLNSADSNFGGLSYSTTLVQGSTESSTTTTGG